VTFHPWSALLPAALLTAWVGRRRHPAFGFLLGWTVGPLILLELVRTKLVHYYLPAYPACALLAAWLIGAVAHKEVNLRRWPLGRLSVGILGGVGIGGTAALAAGVVMLPGATRWPFLVLAVLMGAGTLGAIERFHKGATERAALTLVAAWAMILAVTGAWLLPAAEPYRYSRVVAERLAVLSDRYHAAPMLATFQEPSMIYTLGRPVAIMRGRDDLLNRLRREGAIVSALLPQEVRTLRNEPDFSVDVLEPIRGFNLSKGRSETLQFGLIRLKGSRVAGLTQQSVVK
jgi:4-amino-4-deoxy-L-arabinose transferase-like glycosyltransferase